MEKQVIGRAQRLGASGRVVVQKLMTDKTLEVAIHDAVNSSRATQSQKRQVAGVTSPFKLNPKQRARVEGEGGGEEDRGEESQGGLGKAKAQQSQKRQPKQQKQMRSDWLFHNLKLIRPPEHPLPSF